MVKVFQKFDTAVNDLERVIIDETIATHERVFLRGDIWQGVVWKTWTDDIIQDYKWSDTKDYIKWIKQLGFKEVNELDSITIGLNEKEYKKYIGIEQQIEAAQTIKVTFEDKEYLTTKINGTAEDIIRHYEKNNQLSNGRKVGKIEFLEGPVLQNSSSYAHLFLNESAAAI